MSSRKKSAFRLRKSGSIGMPQKSSSGGSYQDPDTEFSSSPPLSSSKNYMQSQPVSIKRRGYHKSTAIDAVGDSSFNDVEPYTKFGGSASVHQRHMHGDFATRMVTSSVDKRQYDAASPTSMSVLVNSTLRGDREEFGVDENVNRIPSGEVGVRERSNTAPARCEVLPDKSRFSRLRKSTSGADIVPRRSCEAFEADEIVPGVWLGSVRAALSPWIEFERRNIRAVLSVGHELPQPHRRVRAALRRLLATGRPIRMRHMRVAVHDHRSENLMQFFDACSRFICLAQKRRESVLVHCQAGVSRSATIVAAYLLRTYPGIYTAAQALELIREARPRARPNVGFGYQLRLYARLGARIPPLYSWSKKLKIAQVAQTNVTPSGATHVESVELTGLDTTLNDGSQAEKKFHASTTRLSESPEMLFLCNEIKPVEKKEESKFKKSQERMEWHLKNTKFDTKLVCEDSSFRPSTDDDDDDDELSKEKKKKKSKKKKKAEKVERLRQEDKVSQGLLLREEEKVYPTAADIRQAEWDIDATNTLDHIVPDSTHGYSKIAAAKEEYSRFYLASLQQSLLFRIAVTIRDDPKLACVALERLLNSKVRALLPVGGWRCKKCTRFIVRNAHKYNHLYTAHSGRPLFEERYKPVQPTCPPKPGDCSKMFVVPSRWMLREKSIAFKNRGPLHCPACSTKLGEFSWNGALCGCGHLVEVAFFIDRDLVVHSSVKL